MENKNVFSFKSFFSYINNNLRIWNGFMGFLHLVQGVLMWVLSKEVLREVIWNLPKPQLPPGGFQALRESGRRAPVVFQNETWFTINLGQTIACFLLLSALFHFIIISPKI